MPAIADGIIFHKLFSIREEEQMRPTKQILGRVSLGQLLKLHRTGTPITCITAHDYLTGRVVDSSPNVDMVLIGDSLAMTAHGYASTVQIGPEAFMASAGAVARAIQTKFLVADLPYGTYESSVAKCIESSVALMRLGNVDAVKLEGGESVIPHVRGLIGAGIPVCGHLGLQPQRAALAGGYKVQGKTAASAIRLFEEVKMLKDVGVQMLVLECVPAPVAEFITNELDVLTIGIGAGPNTSGQVLVIADMLGMSETSIEKDPHAVSSPLAKCLPNAAAPLSQGDRTLPKFVNMYADLFQIARGGVDQYGAEVKTRAFPRAEHTYPIKEAEFKAFVDHVRSHY